MSDLPKVGRIRSWLAASAATILSFSAVTTSAAQSIQWRFNLTNSSSLTRITGVKAGPAGECYVLGEFSGTLALGRTNITETPTTGGNSFLAKISRFGALEWIRQISGAYSVPYDMAVDSSGQVFVDGFFGGNPVDFGTTNLPAPLGNWDIFVAKYSPGGALLWARRVGGEGSEVPALHSLALGPEGGCYLSGTTYSTNVYFDSVTLTNGKLIGSVFLARLAARGEVVWAQWCGEPALLVNQSIASDPSGNVIMAGHQSNGGGSYGWTNVIAPGGRGLVIAKFNPAGEVLWAQAEAAASPGASGVGYDVHAIAAEQSGSLILSGRFQGGDTAIRFGDLVSTNLTPSDGTYLVRLGGNGAAEWVKTAVTTDVSICPLYLMNSVSVASSGEVYLGGGISARRAEFDSLVATNRGGVDGVMVRVNAAGQFDRCVQLAGLGNDFMEAITLDSAGNIFAGVRSTSTNVTFLGRELSFSRKRGLSILKIATEVPPPLGISRSSNHVTLRWSALARGFHVETASAANTPLRWTRCAPIIRTIGLTNTTTFRRTSDNRFFRLKRNW